MRQGAGGRRRTFDGLADQFLPGTLRPAVASRCGWPTRTSRWPSQLGRENKVPMRLANMTLEEMTEAMNRGWADRDSRVAMLLQEERAGVEIKVPAAALKEVLDKDRK